MPEQYDAAIRRRLALIDQMGTDANARAASMQQARMAQQSYQGMPQVDTGFSPPSLRGDFGSFVRAISGRESGGNYRARNPDSGALGKYQIMPGNVAPWAREILGHSISTSQFYNSPQLQEQIAQGMLRKYYNQYGPEGAAVAWYAGPGTARRYLRDKGRGYNAPQGKYSSISAYALGILKAMGLR